jgi:hypothetical protein
MSKFETKNEGGKLLVVRRTKKGDKKHYLALVAGEGTGDFKLDLHFMSEDDLLKPVEFEPDTNGVNTAVEEFEAKPDDIFQVGLKGERAQFMTINSKGQLLNIDRRSVHESLGIEWEERAPQR